MDSIAQLFTKQKKDHSIVSFCGEYAFESNEPDPESGSEDGASEAGSSDGEKLRKRGEDRDLVRELAAEIKKVSTYRWK